MPGGSPSLRKHALELATLQLTSTAQNGPQVQIAMDCIQAGNPQLHWVYHAREHEEVVTCC